MPEGRRRLDEEQQRAIQHLILGPLFYQWAWEGRYVFVEGNNPIKDFLNLRGCDTLANGRSGALIGIEEKIVRWTGRAYSAICYEMFSCSVPGRTRIGWGHPDHELHASYLNYVFCQEDGSVICHFMPFPELRKMVWESRDQFNETKTTQSNETESLLVPVEWMKAQFGERYVIKHLEPDEAGRTAVKTFNGSHYLKPA